MQRVNGELRKLNACVVEPFPVYTLTEEESARALELQSQLGPYVDETLARVVLGELDADEAQTFVEGLEERGMQEMIDLWQSVAGRLGRVTQSPGRSTRLHITKEGWMAYEQVRANDQ